MSGLRQTCGLLSATVAVLAPGQTLVAAEYLTLEAAQRAVFPEATRFEPLSLVMTATQRQAVAALAGPQPPRGRLRAWRAGRESAVMGYFFVDEVLGRQDFIDYAAGINADGTLRTPEIMAYRESHGGEVRNATWRRQFAKRGDGVRLRASVDIKNIAGATLSCEHLTAGIRYLSALWQVLLPADMQGKSP